MVIDEAEGKLEGRGSMDRNMEICIDIYIYIYIYIYIERVNA